MAKTIEGPPSSRPQRRFAIGHFWSFARRMATGFREHLAASQARTAELKALGICTMCGECPAQTDDDLCPSCRGNQSAAP